MVVDNLLLDHVGLPHVLVLTVHLVNLLGWMGKGDHSKIGGLRLGLDNYLLLTWAPLIHSPRAYF